MPLGSVPADISESPGSIELSLTPAPDGRSETTALNVDRDDPRVLEVLGLSEPCSDIMQ